MADTNRGVVYRGSGTVTVEDLDYPKLTLDDAPAGYREFDQGAARKYVLDPHGLVNA